jgi:hypothetical protein
VIVVTIDGGKREFPDGTRFYTEEVFNNLCIENVKEELLAVFAHDKWTYVEVVGDGPEA